MTAADVVRRVAVGAGIPLRRLLSPCRAKSLVRVRWCAMWLLHRHLRMSTPEIARAVGRKDHATVLHGLRGIRREFAERPEYAAEIERIWTDAQAC